MPKATEGGNAKMKRVARYLALARRLKARAPSSGEAEWYAMLTGCAECLGMQSLAEGLVWKVDVKIWTYSSSAKAIENRRGLGTLGHVELKWLWVQDMVKEGRVKLKMVNGEEPVADHLTKPKTKAGIEEMFVKVAAHFEE